jgi:uncharacterized membrane protein
MKKFSPVVFIILFGVFLRFFSLNQSLWLDEATTALVARDYSWTYTISNFLPKDFHPPLYYFLIKLWSIAFGTSEISLRVPSIIFSSLSVFYIYKIGERVSSKSEGLLAALFLSVSPLFVYYSQEARMYTLSVFEVTLSMYLFLSLLQKKPSNTHWLAFSLSLLLIFFTDYLPTLIFPVFWILAIWGKKEKTWWFHFTFAHIPLIIGFTLFFPVFSTQLLSGLSVKTSSQAWWNTLGKTSLKEIILIPIKFTTGRISFTNKLLHALAFLLPFSIYSYLLSKTKQIKFLPIWLWLLVPIALAIILGNFVSVLSYFRLIFTLPAFCLLLALGLSKLKEMYFIFTLIGIFTLNLLFCGIYLANVKFQRGDWRGLVQFVDQDPSTNKLILFPSTSQMETVSYYQPKTPFVSPESLSDQFEKVFYIHYVPEISDPQGKAKESLERYGYQKNKEHSFNGIIVWQYN